MKKTVDEIIAIAPRLSKGDAAKLLKRAEEFVQPKVSINNAAARKLVEF